MTTATAIQSDQAIEIRPLTGALGAEIYGVDLANLDDATFAQIHQAFLDYSVLMFHDQELDQQQFADFGKRFGKLEDEPFSAAPGRCRRGLLPEGCRRQKTVDAESRLAHGSFVSTEPQPRCDAVCP